MTELRFTAYFLATRTRPDRVMIQDNWLRFTIDNPIREELQLDGRIRRWARIAEFDNRVLRVILLKDGVTVHNAFFDRDFED
jgi:hypothetical protein